MKSIIVKTENGVACYMSPIRFSINEDNTRTKIEQTDEEELQYCYQSLIDDVKRKEFDKSMKLLILSYLGWEEEKCENIKIVVDGIKNCRHCEMNISVNIDPDKWQPVELPNITN